ncbi:MAG: type VI secretion system contractile sheath small subunit, partial [Sulfitobacter sp.]|nr:type VI secretion system contractile sheath small subunit [Sulfitobacter sp.]
LDALLADLDADTDAGNDPETGQDAGDDLDALMADLDAGDDAPSDDTDLDALMADLGGDDETPADAPDDIDALMADLDTGDTPAQTDAGDDLDALLAGLDDESATANAADDDLDAMMAGLEDTPAPDTSTDDDLDALLNDLETDTDLTARTEAADDLATDADTGATLSEEPKLAYGQMSADRPEPQKLERKRFRLAILGDFTGRSARGLIEVGDALASRKPILLDPDTVEDVIEGFATTLVLPIGKDGAGVEVKLGGLDDLHPDELYENVELFSALRDLKSQLSHGGTAEHAAKSLKAWGEAHGRPVAPAKAVSGGNTVRADLKLSDFQKLIGDTSGQLAQPSPIDDLLARVVGPHIRKLPDPNTVAMAEAVDDALSAAMRLVLHHPEFQSVEAQWRAIDLIARSIETDDTLDVMLYDISAEEIAADLTQSDDLSTSGFVRLLTEGPMDEETGRGGYSALIGMYTFEETPPHAQLLGRIARVAAHVDAPFFAAITPAFIDTPKEDRHPLVAAEWDTLRAMPEAGHLALATPRFLLRRPYGAKSEPIYEFDFEEFTQSAGLSGMLWANPVVLVSILLAKSFRENGPSMGLGQIMSLGDMPYHFVNDRYGDQVALPCTERNLTLDKVDTVLGRGYLPVVSIKGRDEIRLASFQSLAGGDVLGPWAGVAPPPPSPPKPPKAAAETAPEADEDPATDDDDLDALLSGFDLDADDSDDDLSNNDDEMDAELAALLADL